MRILTAELRKTFTLRFFLVLLIAVAANFLLFRHNLSGSYSFYGQEAYVALQKEVIAMGDEGYAYMQEQVELLNACMDWETYESFAQQGFTMEITEEMLKYQAVYEKGEYLRYTDYLFSERSLHNTVFRLMEQAQDHKLTLQNAIDDAKQRPLLPSSPSPVPLPTGANWQPSNGWRDCCISNQSSISQTVCWNPKYRQ